MSKIPVRKITRTITVYNCNVLILKAHETTDENGETKTAYIGEPQTVEVVGYDIPVLHRADVLTDIIRRDEHLAVAMFISYTTELRVYEMDERTFVKGSGKWTLATVKTASDTDKKATTATAKKAT